MECNEFCDKVLALLEDGLYRACGLSLPYLAESLGCRCGNAGEVFEDITGIPFEDVLAAFRIREVCSLVRDKGVRLVDAWKFSGFRSFREYRSVYGRFLGKYADCAELWECG